MTTDAKTTARIVIRSSQGTEDKISLDVQREKTKELAENLGVDEYEVIDLGIHTGFSLFMRPDSDDRIDTNDRILHLLDELKRGEPDYLIAYNQSRLARDDFLTIYWYNCLQGDVEMKFHNKFDMRALSDRVEHLVEMFIKMKEIEQSKKALEKRREKNAYEGEPPFGTKYDEDKLYLEPNGRFEQALEVLRLKNQGATHREVVDHVQDVKSTGTVTNIKDRKDKYVELAVENGYDIESLV